MLFFTLVNIRQIDFLCLSFKQKKLVCVKKLFKNIALVITHDTIDEYLSIMASLGILFLDPSKYDDPTNDNLYKN